MSDDQLRSLTADLFNDTWPDEYPTRFVFLVETVDATGNKYLRIASSEDMTGWERLGLIEYARQIEQAATIAKVSFDDG